MHYKEFYESKGRLQEGISYDSLGNSYQYTEYSTSATAYGGVSSYFAYIRDHLKYPLSAQRGGVEGRVYVQFIVDKNGKIIDAEVIKGFHKECDVAALKVIRNAPNWIPGIVRGQPVKVKMILPVNFRLR